MTGCVFCRIVTGDAPSEIVAQNERALAVLDIHPATDGHTLVISKAHAADIWELRPEDGKAVWLLTSDVAGAIRDSLHPEG
ncbi:MAG: HIT domain-containing protein, partial [Actinomycetota bacterium]